MKPTYEELMNSKSGEQLSSIEEAFNNYLSLQEDPLLKLAMKRQGQRRDILIDGLRELAALFAMSRSVDDEQEFDDFVEAMIEKGLFKHPDVKNMQDFYLGQIDKIAGANDLALERLTRFYDRYHKAQKSLT